MSHVWLLLTVLTWKSAKSLPRKKRRRITFKLFSSPPPPPPLLRPSYWQDQINLLTSSFPCPYPGAWPLSTPIAVKDQSNLNFHGNRRKRDVLALTRPLGSIFPDDASLKKEPTSSSGRNYTSCSTIDWFCIDLFDVDVLSDKNFSDDWSLCVGTFLPSKCRVPRERRRRTQMRKYLSFYLKTALEERNYFGLRGT